MPTAVDTSLFRKVVSFNLYPASIIGTSYNLVTVLAILDADTAMTYTDVQALHVNVYPTIPVAVRPTDDYASYQYLKVKLPNGAISVIGIPWIDGDITIHEANTLNVTISNVGAEDVEKVRKALIANGYNDVAITLA